ncbi:hypothetical protein [Altererythrobacter sp. Z27]|uniref:hypothetical protein n=1 Tax=Altererythrobacter sp. Z27 TaxID=3461147 RepID=UPI004043CEEB
MSIDYLIENAIILDKTVTLGASAKVVAPFGLRRGDGHETAARKIRDIVGVSSEYWTDYDDEAASYLQSEAVNCEKKQSFTIYVWFRDGKALSVSASTLPAI